MDSQQLIIPIALLMLIGYIHRQIARTGAFFLVISNVPITIMHELAHYVLALLLGGKPTGFTLWPKREGGRWVLGSVTAGATIISTGPTALAPLLWLCAARQLLIDRTSLAEGSVQILCCVYVAAYLCIAASIPSWQDIKVALMHPLSLILWGIVLAAAHHLIR